MIQYEIKGLDRIIQKTSPRLLSSPLKDFWKSVTRTVQARVRGHVPVWTGGLKSEVVTRTDSAEVPLRGEVGYLNASEGSSLWFQARAMEWGTGRQGDKSVSHASWHQPSGAALDPWAKAHGFETGWQAARAIGKKGGLKPHLALRRGLAESISDIRNALTFLGKSIQEAWNK